MKPQTTPKPEPKIEPRRDYTTHEAGQLLEPPIGRAAILNHVRVGNITAEKRGRDYFINGLELMRFRVERLPKGRPKDAERERLLQKYA